MAAVQRFALVVASSAILLTLCNAVLPTPTENYPFRHVMQDQDRYMLYWKIDAGTITFETHVLTTGWVGLGFSPSGEMAGADIMLGWVNGGQVTIKDRYAETTVLPKLDAQQDWKTISGKTENGYTILKFSRALNTGDCLQDQFISSDTLRVIWSYGTDLPSDDTNIKQHTNRGTVSVNFLDSTVQKPMTIPSDVTYWDISMTSFNIPSDRTTYQCRTVRVPSGTYQIVGYEPIIASANAMNVHHIVIYGCYMDLTISFDGAQFDCFRSSQGMQVMQCRNPIAIWAVGSDTYFFPDNTGFPMGGAQDPKFLLMEVHYDNPNGLSNIFDSSGFRFYKTDKLRPTLVGLAEIGHSVSPRQIIPPKLPAFTTTGVCHSDCTTQSLPDSGITVFATALHSHLLGSKVRVRQFRGESEIGDLGIDNHYDFNMQVIRVFSKPRTVKKGDTLVVECVLDSSKRPTVTFGGIGTGSEMCLAFVYYYPKGNFGNCQSDPMPTPDILASIGATGTSQEEIFMNLALKTDWKPAEVKTLQDFETKAKLNIACRGNGAALEVDGQVKDFPSFVKPYQPPAGPCGSTDMLRANFALLSSVLLFLWISL